MTEQELQNYAELADDWTGTSGEVQLGDAVRRLIAEVRALTEDIKVLQNHINGGNCGFDRNASHSENTYVCTCGYRG